MANGNGKEVLQEIRALLDSGDRISTPTALRLSLALQEQLYTRVEKLCTEQDRQKELLEAFDRRLCESERHLTEAQGKAAQAETEAKEAQAHSPFTRALGWFAEKVLPSLVTTAIVLIISFIVAVSNHIQLVQGTP